MTNCIPAAGLGLIRGVLQSVDCNTRGFARLGYESLTATGSNFQLALTLLLVIYVATLGYRMLFASGASLSDGPGIALKIGAVLALVSSWSLFQTLVFDMAAGVPMELAGLITAPMRESHSLASDPLSGLQLAYDRLSAAAMHFSHPPTPMRAADMGDQATAGQVLSWAAIALFIASGGLVAVITLALGVLGATGPLFVALFLFLETRGLFVGWIRALVSCAIGLNGTWSLSVLMLRVIQPWLLALAQSPATDAASTAITTGAIVIVFSCGQLAMVLAGVMIAQGFDLRGNTRVMIPGGASAPTEILVSAEPSRAARLAEQLQRDAVGDPVGNRARIVSTPSGFDRTPASAGLAGARLGDLYRRPAISAQSGDPR